MKLNRSLAISSKIQECKAGEILGLLEKEFPFDILEDQWETADVRKRVFTTNATLLTMVLTAIQEDKTLKNSVNLFYIFHQKHREQALEKLKKETELEKVKDKASPRKRGRPKEYSVQLPKSLEKNISQNTAAYSKARTRLSLSLTRELFEASRIKDARNDYTHWHGYKVFIADGTYIQMQDTKEIRRKYEVKYNGKGTETYPQGLLEVLTERGTGQMHSFNLSDKHTSELALFHDLIDGLPPKSLVLIDALYDCYETLAKCHRKGIELIVPYKKPRNYETVEVFGKGDEIIRIKPPKDRSKWLTEHEQAPFLLLRQVKCKSPEGKEYILHTSILDKNIDKEEIQLLYLTRWDIEISIMEVKTIMDINILRSKTPDMALKELTVTLATYNLLRKLVYASIKNLPFSPKEDFIQKFYTFNKDIYIDKKGRVYNRWSPGRKGARGTNTKTNPAKEETI